jgi:S-adenosylmethionine decarboxylase
MMTKLKPFGYLFTLDLYGCRDGVCDDLAFCYKFLEVITDRLEMKRQSPPFIFKTDELTYPDKAGLSGWVPLVESGIQIHTLSPKKFISIDIYSCRKFHADSIHDFVQSYFDCKEVEVNFIERGVKYGEIHK